MMEYAPSQADIANQVLGAWSEPEDGKAMVLFGPDAATVQGTCLAAVGHFASADMRWISLVGPDRIRGMTVVLHNFSLNGDAEMIPCGSLGLMGRHARSCLAWWAFNVIGLNRITVRIRASDRRLQDFMRRLGLRHEGTQREFYGPGQDCSLWGLTHDEARLLLKREPVRGAASTDQRVH